MGGSRESSALHTAKHTDPSHVVPGNGHEQVGHLGPNSRQVHQLRNGTGDVTPVLLLQDCGRLFYVLHLVLGNQSKLSSHPRNAEEKHGLDNRTISFT